jgi:hypothetical protein
MFFKNKFKYQFAFSFSFILTFICLIAIDSDLSKLSNEIFCYISSFDKSQAQFGSQVLSFIKTEFSQ